MNLISTITKMPFQIREIFLSEWTLSLRRALIKLYESQVCPPVQNCMWRVLSSGNYVKKLKLSIKPGVRQILWGNKTGGNNITGRYNHGGEPWQIFLGKNTEIGHRQQTDTRGKESKLFLGRRGGGLFFYVYSKKQAQNLCIGA